MADLALYRLAMQRTEALLATLDDAELDRTCQACPLWSIRDVVAHHVHYLGAVVADDVPREMYLALGGTESRRVEAGRTRDEWTQAGVQTRRGRPLADVLVEWTAIVDTMAPSAAGSVLDLTMHLADIHETLGTGERPDQPLVDDALAGYVHFFLTPRLSNARALPLRLVCTDTGAELAGDGDGRGTKVRGSSYDLLRVVGGRRTRADADAALDWCDTSPEARDLVSLYGWPG